MYKALKLVLSVYVTKTVILGVFRFKQLYYILTLYSVLYNEKECEKNYEKRYSNAVDELHGFYI